MRVVRGQPTSDGAGVKLTRVIGQRELDMLDPFLLLDEFGTRAFSCVAPDGYTWTFLEGTLS